jgi:hypothetical protein
VRTILLAALACLPAVSGCQSPTDPDDVIGVDEYVDVAVNPDPILADVGDGKIYRVTVNDAIETRIYDYKASFSMNVTLNSTAADSDVDLAFPVDITAITADVDQASGGIRNPPTGGEIEHFESVIVQTTGNRYAAASSSNTVGMDLWYDLPSLRKEALITLTIAFRDADGVVFSRVAEFRIAP